MASLKMCKGNNLYTCNSLNPHSLLEIKAGFIYIVISFQIFTNIFIYWINYSLCEELTRFAHLAWSSSIRSLPDTWKVWGWSSLLVSTTFMPSIPIRVRTVYLGPPRLNLGTQYNSMLLNWRHKTQIQRLHSEWIIVLLITASNQ